MRLSRIAILVAISIVVLYMLESHREGVVFSGASPYNTGWDGTSNLVEYLKTMGSVEIVNRWSSNPVPDEGYSCRVVLFISPEKKFREEEIRAVADLVKNRGYSLVILDEGSYSNALLEALDLPIRIEAFRYVKVYPLTEPATIQPTHTRYSAVEETPGFIELDRVHYIVFFYVSPVSIERSTHRCRAVAYTVNNYTVGVACQDQGGKVIAIGDSSIAINAVIPPVPVPTEGMYTTAIKRIVNYVCGNKTDKILFLVDSSKYRLRVLSFSELVKEGYGGVEALILTSNPFRYLYTHIVNSEIPFVAISSLGAASGFVAASGYAMKKHAKDRHRKAPEDMYKLVPGYGQSTVKLVVDLCRSDSRCVNEVPCVLKDINKKCIKMLSRYVSRSRIFRRNLVERILSYR